MVVGTIRRNNVKKVAQFPRMLGLFNIALVHYGRNMLHCLYTSWRYPTIDGRRLRYKWYRNKEPGQPIHPEHDTSGQTRHLGLSWPEHLREHALVGLVALPILLSLLFRRP